MEEKSQDKKIVRVTMNVSRAEEHPSFLELRIRPKIYKKRRWVPIPTVDAIWVYYEFEKADEADKYYKYIEGKLVEEKNISVVNILSKSSIWWN